MQYIESSTGLWEVVIGLEVHAQVISKSKLFSVASTQFGSDQNANVSFVDAAFPGVLPVLNSFCVDQAIKTGLGLNGNVNLVSYFDRKNYFYPDLPSGYQISQFRHPIVSGGYVEIDIDGAIKKVNIERIHIEQDAGKSIHDMSPSKTYIDLNRAGIALMEIVTKPDMRSAEEAATFLRKLRAILRYLNTCDGNMDEGSMRADVNVSICRPSSEFGTRVEIKNVNSIKFLSTAVHYEVKRQIDLVENGGSVSQETRLFDASVGETRPMRSKENAHDYRYFPDPDLPPLILEQSRVDAIKSTIPELPDSKAKRPHTDYDIPMIDADLISLDIENAHYYEDMLLAANNVDKDTAKILANWFLVELFALLNKYGIEIKDCIIPPQDLTELVIMIKEDVISGKIAKDVLSFMWEEKKKPSIIVKEKSMFQISSDSEIEKIIKEVLDQHQDKVADYKSGKDKLFGFFVGQVMKKTDGKANPQKLNTILAKLLS